MIAAPPISGGAVVLTYHPHDFQRLFHASAAPLRVCMAGTRGGKSRAISVECQIAMMKMPGSVGLIISPDYPQHNRNLRPYLDELLLPIGKYSERDHKYELKNGSVAWVLYADKPNSMRGVGADWVCGDELRLWTREAWQVVQTRMDKTWSRFWGATTPNGRDWVWEEFLEGSRSVNRYGVEEVHPDRNRRKAVWVWKTVDNTAVPGMAEVVANMRETQPAQFWRQEYEASIEQFTGAVYPDYGDDHFIDAFEIPNWWERVIGVDTGASDPTAMAAFAVSPEGVWYQYGESCERGKTTPDRHATLTELIGDALYWTVRVGDDAKQEMLDLEAMGMPVTPAARDFISRYSRVTDALRTERYKVFRTCEITDQALRRYVWPPETEGGSQRDRKPLHGQSDLPDAIGYAFGADLSGSRPPRPAAAVGPTWDSVVRLIKRARHPVGAGPSLRLGWG